MAKFKLAFNSQDQKINAPKGFDDFDLKLGDTLRGERATLCKSVVEVQNELKIKASYISAIENCAVPPSEPTPAPTSISPVAFSSTVISIFFKFASGVSIISLFTS